MLKMKSIQIRKAGNKYFIKAVIIFFFPLQVFAWDNPCNSKAVHFQSIPHDKESAITLEAKRVVSVNNDTFDYNLGKEIIIIRTESFASQRFVKDVKAGRCSARETVTLVPERKSPFNQKFRAVRHNEKNKSGKQ